MSFAPIVEQFHRPYDLTQARKLASKKVPASHQSDALAKLYAWFDSKSVLPSGGILVLPTGGGKTFVATRFLCTGPLSQGYKVLWLAHTHHLLDQAFYSFGPKDEQDIEKIGFEVGKIAEPRSKLSIRVVSGTAEHFPVHQIKAQDDVVIATLQTIARAYNDPQQRGLQGFLDSAKGKLIVVFDEAHHSPAPSYRKLMLNLRERYPGTCLLGLTATPTYSDEAKKGWLKKIFPQGIIYQVTPQKLMADRILARPVLEEPTTQFTPQFEEREYQTWIGTYRDLPESVIDQLANSKERNSAIVATYLQNKERYGKTIMFADRWYQCEQLREFLRVRGVKADVVYSHVDADPGSAEARNRRDKDENRKVLEAFKRNELEVLINVRMLTEGTDVPDVNTVFLTRQSTSQILLTQMVGRALRGPKFGGTEKAYIVAFIDNWQQAIQWAGYDQLADGRADEGEVEYGKRPPLQLLSVELVRKLIQQMDSVANIESSPYLSLMPVGWYRVEFEALVAGSEDLEIVRELVMVFENQQESYRNFIQQLTREDLAEFEDPKVTLERALTRLEDWQAQFFTQNQSQERANRDVVTNLFHLARHIAQNGLPPAFFLFEERDNHNLDKVAQQFGLEDKLNILELDDALFAEYQRKDRYWSAIYYSYELFKSQYDACINRLLYLRRHGRSSQEGIQIPKNSVIGPADLMLDRGPSYEVKKQVKKRDEYRCLCCGEINKRLLQIDHVAPSYYGGLNSLANLQTLCGTCNRTKGVNTLNFLIHRTPLAEPPSGFPVFALPTLPKDPEEWEKFLRRSLNFFYRCAAIESIKISKRSSGQYFYDWQVSLYEGNNPAWLKPHLADLLARINELRRETDLLELKSIRVSAPG